MIWPRSVSSCNSGKLRRRVASASVYRCSCKRSSPSMRADLAVRIPAPGSAPRSRRSQPWGSAASETCGACAKTDPQDGRLAGRGSIPRPAWIAGCDPSIATQVAMLRAVSSFAASLARGKNARMVFFPRLLRNPAGQLGGLLHPRRHLRLVELVAFADVDPARLHAHTPVSQSVAKTSSWWRATRHGSRHSPHA